MSTHKVPVFATLTQVLGFCVREFLTVIRLSWFPFAIYAAASAALVGWAFFGGPMQIIDLSLIEIAVTSWLFDSLLFAIALSSVAVSIHRLILFGDRNSGSYFQFPFGSVQMRYFTMTLVVSFVVLAARIACLIGAVYLAQAGKQPLSAVIEDFIKMGLFAFVVMRPGLTPDQWLIAGSVQYAVSGLLLAYLSLWPATIVAEGRTTPGSAIGLIQGNFLRVVGLYALIGGFLAAVSSSVVLLILAQANPAELAKITFGDPGGHFDTVIWRTLALGVVENFVVALGSSALGVAAVSYSYKAIRGIAPGEFVPVPH